MNPGHAVLEKKIDGKIISCRHTGGLKIKVPDIFFIQQGKEKNGVKKNAVLSHMVHLIVFVWIASFQNFLHSQTESPDTQDSHMEKALHLGELITSFQGNLVHEENIFFEDSPVDEENLSGSHSIRNINTVGFANERIKIIMNPQVAYLNETGQATGYMAQHTPNTIEFGYDGEKAMEYWPDKKYAFIEKDGGRKDLDMKYQFADPGYFLRYISGCTQTILRTGIAGKTVRQEKNRTVFTATSVVNSQGICTRIQLVFDERNITAFTLSASIPGNPSNLVKVREINIDWNDSPAGFPRKITNIAYRINGEKANLTNIEIKDMRFNQLAYSPGLFELKIPKNVIFEDKRVGISVHMGFEEKKFEQSIDRIDTAINQMIDDTSSKTISPRNPPDSIRDTDAARNASKISFSHKTRAFFFLCAALFGVSCFYFMKK